MKKFPMLVAAVLSLTASFLPLYAEEESSDDVFVSLTRRPDRGEELPTNIAIITAEDIKASGAKSLDEVIDRATSVDVSRSGSLGSFASVRMRGTPSSSQVQIIVDDQPFGGFAADQLVNLALIPIENVERIEFVRGGSSVLYGANTTGGVVHIITKQKLDRPSVAAGYEARSFDTDIFRGEAGGGLGRADVFATASRYKTDGFQKNSDAENVSASGRAGYSWSNGSRLSVQAAGHHHESGTPQGSSVPISDWDGERERAAANPTKRSDNKRAEGQLRYATPVGGGNVLQALFYGSRSRFASFNSIGLFDPDYSRRADIFGNDLRFLSGKGFTAGFAYEKDWFHDSNDFNHDLGAWGVYAEQKLKSARWTVIPAVRFDRNGNFGSQTNPRLSMVFQAAPAWDVTANAARSFRAPSFFDLFFDIPGMFQSNRNLKPESAWTYDLGNRVRIGENHEIKVTGFYTKMKDRIAGVDTDGDFINDTNANISRAESEGAEFECSSRLGPVLQRGNYAYIRSRGTSVNGSQYRDFVLTPHHTANYDVTVFMPMEVRLSNYLQYVSKQFQSIGETGTELPSYAVWNARLSKAFKGSEIFFGVNNILDRRYAESFDFDPNSFAVTLNPQPTRTYWGGVSVKFPPMDEQ